MTQVIPFRRKQNAGWGHVQLDSITKVQKSWSWEDREYRVDAYFGTLRDGNFTPVVIMNVYEQGAIINRAFDDNCDMWQNTFTSTTKDEGNEYFKYLRKHGFTVCKEDTSGKAGH